MRDVIIQSAQKNKLEKNKQAYNAYIYTNENACTYYCTFSQNVITQKYRKHPKNIGNI